MIKPPIIKTIEEQTGLQLTRMDGPAELMKYRNQNTFTLDTDGQVTGLNLRSNGLSDNKITFLPELTRLEALNLSENDLEQLVIPPKMMSLRFLDLSENKNLHSVELKPELHTSPLEWIDLNECALASFTLPSLLLLKKLDISRNTLTELVFQGDCPALVMLDVSGNQLKSFMMPGFSALKYLYLNDNQLEEFRFQWDLTSLEVLHLRGNRLESLPYGLLASSELKALYLHGNPLSALPKEVVADSEYESSWVQVRDFLLNLQQGDRVNDRVKIIIVGNGRVGKTSIYKRLKGLPFDEKEKYTHGIAMGALEDKDLPDIKTGTLHASVWDFGGQEIFYATHQFFLSEDALYILAWTSEKNVLPHRLRDEGNLPLDEKWQSCEYWLENIRLHGKNSPIMMVQTHSDRERESIKAEYQKAPYQAECLNFSAAKDYGLPELKDLLVQKLNSEIPFLGKKFPESYETLIRGIENNRATEPFIPRRHFDDLCKKAGIVEGTESSALDFLNRAGVVVFFDKEKLREVIYIDPNWLTQQVYRLINNDLRDREGRIDEPWLVGVLPEYTPQDRIRLIELLRNFELIFADSTQKGQVWIAPQYLPQAPQSGENDLYDIFMDDVSPAFRFRFPKFMPDNVMINFLSRYGPFSRKQYWHDAICFTNTEKVKCSVVFRKTGQCLQVSTDGSDRSKALQKEICQAFVELSKNANAEISIDGRHFVSWQKLVEAHKLENRNVLATDEKTPLPVEDFVHLLDHREGAGPDLKSLKSSDKASNEASERLPLAGMEPGLAPFPRPGTAKTKILFVAANPEGSTREQTDVEHRRLKDQLLRGRAREQFEFLHPQLAVTIHELLRAMNDEPDIVHFSGSGTSGGIIITNEMNDPQMMSVAALERLFKKSKARIVVLNACYSAEQARTISEYGIYVVGNNMPISDPAAISFSEGFYNGIGEGKNFEDAFNDAMVVILTVNAAAADMIEVWKNGEKLKL